VKIRKKITGGQGWAAFSGETQLNVTFCVPGIGVRDHNLQQKQTEQP
jgi:hypothetical protein